MAANKQSNTAIAAELSTGKHMVVSGANGSPANAPLELVTAAS
ncbi:hypothetical protein [Methylobacterium sp. Leaf123]|nr:hypothetical protein [Methylobacterium sp. Leaf123]